MKHKKVLPRVIVVTHKKSGAAKPEKPDGRYRVVTSVLELHGISHGSPKHRYWQPETGSRAGAARKHSQQNVVVMKIAVILWSSSKRNRQGTESGGVTI